MVGRGRILPARDGKNSKESPPDNRGEFYDFGFGIWNLGFGILDLGFWIWDFGFGI
jgi:hypothetical protein